MVPSRTTLRHCQAAGALLLLFLSSCTPVGVSGFTPPSRCFRTPPIPSKPLVTASSSSFTQLSAAIDPGMMLPSASSTGTTLLDNPLVTYFLQTVIANGVPALFTIAVIGFTAVQFRNSNNNRRDDPFNNNNAVAQLYDDLYGDQQQGNGNNNNPFAFMNNKNKNQLPRNTGVPKQQFLKVTHLNQQRESYQYSLTAATQSKAAAAAAYRRSAWQRAWQKALSPNVSSELQRLEAGLLKEAGPKVEAYQAARAELQRLAVQDAVQSLGMKSVYELDAAKNETSTNTTITAKKSAPANAASATAVTNTAATLQKELQTLERNFVRDVVQACGPDHAASIQTALAGLEGASLLENLSARPLDRLLLGSNDKDGANPSDTKTHAQRNTLFVTRFPGDTTASQVANLREEVTAILQSAQPGDQALVVLQTGGGTVTGYGLAAAQLGRLKDANIELTIAVEQVAASGGYMMACIADTIVASPFAVLGSIGVISDIPNVYERLKKEGIEFQTVTAGKYKRTLTPTKKPTKEDFAKSKEDVNDIFLLFRDFVKENRPQLDIESVATGETWFGTAAMERKLCDAIQTVDGVITDYIEQGFDVYEIAYKPPPTETALGKFLESAEDDTSYTNAGGSAVSSATQWFVRTVASAVAAELGVSANLNKSVEQRYMAKDDTADRIRSQD